MSESPVKIMEEKGKSSAILSRTNKTPKTPRLEQDEQKLQLSKDVYLVHVNTTETTKEQNEKLSQTVLTYATKVQAEEMALHEKERLIEEFEQKCHRQEQNSCEIRCDIEQNNVEFQNENKNQESLLFKTNNFSQLLGIVSVSCNAVTNSFQNIVAQREALQTYLGSNSFEQLHNSLDHMADSSPCLEILKNKLSLEQDKYQKVSFDLATQTNAIREQHSTEVALREEISAVPIDIFNLDKQILSENCSVQNLIEGVKNLIIERNEHKYSLQQQIDAVTISCSSITREVEVAVEETKTSAQKGQILQIECSETNVRKDSLESELNLIEGRVEDLSNSLSQNQKELRDLKLQLDYENENGKEINNIIDTICFQLKEIEEFNNKEIADLSEELHNMSSTFAAKDESLQKSLIDAQAENLELSKKEEAQSRDLIQLTEELEYISESHQQILLSNSVFENNLVAFGEKCFELERDKEDLMDLLRTQKSCVVEKNQAWAEAQDTHARSIDDLKCQIVSWTQQENSATEEIDSLNLDEQKLHDRIKSADRNAASSHEQVTEHHESVIEELHKKLTALRKEVESLHDDMQGENCQLQHDLTNVKDILIEKDKLLSCQNVSINTLNEELESCKVMSKNLNMEWQDRDRNISVLKEMSVDCSIKMEAMHEQEREKDSIQKGYQCKCLELDDLNATLNSAHRGLEETLSKLMVDNDATKQAYSQLLVNFQSTFKMRSDEISGLQKQISLSTDKISSAEKNNEKKKMSILSLQKLADDSLLQRNTVVNEKQEWQQKVLVSERTMSQAQQEASFTRRKADTLLTKIKAQKAAKNANSLGHTFKFPSQDVAPLKAVTPQFSSSSTINLNDKEITPKSILKSPLRPPTPQEQKKTVAFENDFDDFSSSSASTVVIENIADKVEANPAFLSELRKQYFERQAAKRQMKMNYPRGITGPEMIPSKKNRQENEISSSTPESDPLITDLLN